MKGVITQLVKHHGKALATSEASTGGQRATGGRAADGRLVMDELSWEGLGQDVDDSTNGGKARGQARSALGTCVVGNAHAENICSGEGIRVGRLCKETLEILFTPGRIETKSGVKAPPPTSGLCHHPLSRSIFACPERTFEMYPLKKKTSKFVGARWQKM